MPQLPVPGRGSRYGRSARIRRRARCRRCTGVPRRDEGGACSIVAGTNGWSRCRPPVSGPTRSGRPMPARARRGRAAAVVHDPCRRARRGTPVGSGRAARRRARPAPRTRPPDWPTRPDAGADITPRRRADAGSAGVDRPGPGPPARAARRRGSAGSTAGRAARRSRVDIFPVRGQPPHSLESGQDRMHGAARQPGLGADLHAVPLDGRIVQEVRAVPAGSGSSSANK